MASRSQRGMALVVALLAVGLAVSTVAFMLSQQVLWLRQSETLHARTQADAAALGALDWARHVLADRAREEGIAALLQRDGRDRLALPSLEEIDIDVEVADAQAKFNLNNLARDRASEPDRAAFGKLLAQLGLPGDLADAVQQAVGEKPLLDIAALARLPAFAPRTFELLEPFVVALPTPTPVNLNSAPAEVLFAVIPGLDMAAARSLEATFANAPAGELDELRKLLPDDVALPPEGALGVQSRYFLVASRAWSGRAVAAYQALLDLEGGAAAYAWRKRSDW